MTAPGGNPVIDVPEYSPRSPYSVVEPVFVTVEAPKTAKLCAEPRKVVAEAGADAHSIAANGTMNPRRAPHPGKTLAMLISSDPIFGGELLPGPSDGRTPPAAPRSRTDSGTHP